MNKILGNLADLYNYAVGALKGTIGFGGTFGATALTKLLKSELWVVASGILSAIKAKELGVPDDKLVSFWWVMATISIGYAVARTVAKFRGI
jgi:hypothetical protein